MSELLSEQPQSTGAVVTKRVPRQVYFVTGTDTDVGKTTVTAALLQRATQQGWRCFGVKPVSAGCQQDDAGVWQSSDAQQIRAAASVTLHPDLLAPIRLPLPVSPHLAAQAAGVNLSVSRLAGLVRGALSTPATHVLIEGAGGWDVPINPRETLADLAKTLQFPVILVVGMRLGCLNHALLTARAIRQDGLQLAGWIANTIDSNTLLPDQQIETLQQRLNAPCLGVLPYQPAQTLQERAGLLRWPQELSGAL